MKIHDVKAGTTTGSQYIIEKFAHKSPISLSIQKIIIGYSPKNDLRGLRLGARAFLLWIWDRVKRRVRTRAGGSLRPRRAKHPALR